MNNNIKTSFPRFIANNYQIREEQYNGKTHLVVPVVMMKEGVHNGSEGPVFHTASELGRAIEAWNGIPVVVYHPQDGDQYISANSPQVLERSEVGRVFNAYMEDEKLKAEVWIDVDKMSRVNSYALEMIKKLEPLDVSVGVINDLEVATGQWNDEGYKGIARNYRPDHLALLPGVAGACSWTDGCGIRANSEGGVNTSIHESARALLKEGLVTLQINQTGYSEVMGRLQEKLNVMDTDTKYHYLVDCYDEYFVYEVRGLNVDRVMYKQNYSVASDNTVTLNGDAIKVARNVEYITVNKEGKPMAKGIDCKTCAAKVQALIVNEHTPYTVEDKDFLMTFEEAHLDKLMDMARTLGENTEEIKKLQVNTEVKPVELTKEQMLQALSGNLTMDEFRALIPGELREQIDTGLKMQANRKAELVTKITANSKSFTKEELDSKSLSELEKITSLIPDPVDYSGMLGGTLINNSAPSVDAFLLPAGVEIKQ